MEYKEHDRRHIEPLDKNSFKWLKAILTTHRNLRPIQTEEHKGTYKSTKHMILKLK